MVVSWLYGKGKIVQGSTLEGLPWFGLAKVQSLADRRAQVAFKGKIVTMSIWQTAVCRCSLGQDKLQQRSPESPETQHRQGACAAFLMLPTPQQALSFALTLCMWCTL